ncbi:MAG: branched-chain amino acid ABC transporter permease [Desulfovibrionaceae bacterium]|nr:branched-chain amino acid ABC transporter permease [Desulfovibrionaceae bacterium]
MFKTRIIKALLAALWFMVLTFPIVGIQVNTTARNINWRWDRIASMGIGIFVLALLWNWCFERKALGLPIIKKLPDSFHYSFNELQNRPLFKKGLPIAILAAMLLMPLVSSIYQTNIMISAMVYVILALGLNIIVGLAGQLVLGYAAFYAVGAYTYGLLYHYFGLTFWACLPLGGLAAVIAGFLLGLPVLGLRGDYLAIVTLGFGEIVRLLLLSQGDITGGPRGISNIPRPSFFGMKMTLDQVTNYTYYLVLAGVLITILVISRLKNSRIGLALQALREDEIACEAMGINTTRIKLTAFMLCSCWAGFAGVIFAAKTTYLNPASFTFMDSAMILSMVVLGGMGSISGVVLAAMLLILAPEYLRAFSEYRMLLFGAVMVLMMIFRPQGIIAGAHRDYHISENIREKASPEDEEGNADSAERASA